MRGSSAAGTPPPTIAPTYAPQKAMAALRRAGMAAAVPACRWCTAASSSPEKKLPTSSPGGAYTANSGSITLAAPSESTMTLPGCKSPWHSASPPEYSGPAAYAARSASISPIKASSARSGAAAGASSYGRVHT